MSFEALLQQLVDRSGALGAALMGNDGIPIAEATAEAAGTDLAEEIGTAGVEFGRILEEIRKASDAIAGGTVYETTILMARMTLVFRNVDSEIFLVTALAPDGNLGKARYLMRRQLLALRQLL